MTDRIPSLPALRAFAAVARLGSFAQAGVALNVSTSAISHRITELEGDLGTQLLHRARNGTGRTVPTPAGESLLTAIDTAFAQLGAACAAVRNKGRTRLAISANGSIAAMWVAPRLASFAAQHPSVQWEVKAIETEPDMMREGLDLAVLRTPRGMIAAGDRLLFQEEVFPVCSPALGLRRDPADLLKHNLLQEAVTSSPEKEWGTWLEILGLSCGAKANMVHFSSFNAAIGAASAGAGVALGRSPLVDLDLASGRLVRPFGDLARPGSWDVVLRRRPGAERDVHVGQLERFLMTEASRSVHQVIEERGPVVGAGDDVAVVGA
jgi:LysR family transcriptional regulator, glycine cleavage system transcriptional activator